MPGEKIKIKKKTFSKLAKIVEKTRHGVLERKNN